LGLITEERTVHTFIIPGPGTINVPLVPPLVGPGFNCGHCASPSLFNGHVVCSKIFIMRPSIRAGY